MRQFFLDHFEAVRTTAEGRLQGKNEQYHNHRTGLRTYILSFTEGSTRLELMQLPGVADADPSMSNIGFTHVSFAEEARRLWMQRPLSFAMLAIK